MKVLGLCAAASLVVTPLQAFTHSRSGGHSFHTWNHRRSLTTPTSIRMEPLYIFGRNKDGDGDENSSFSKPTNDSSLEGKRERGIPFFGRLRQNRAERNEAENSGTATTVAVDKPVETPVAKPAPIVPEPQDAATTAKQLQAQAERARLEAERMDAELTLSKIERLEKQLKDAKKKGESIDEIQRQLNNLQAKLRGEAPKPQVVKKPEPPTEETTSPKREQKAEDFEPDKVVNLADYLKAAEDIEEGASLIDASPGFLKKLIAGMVEVDYDTAADVNSTEVARRLLMVSDGDFTYSKLPTPVYTESQIEDAMKRLEKGEVSYPDDLVTQATGDKRKQAMYILDTEYYIENRLATTDDVFEMLQKAGNGEGAIQGIIDALNATVLDQLITSNYPECTRKEDRIEPTMAQVQYFASTILPKVKFSATSKPEKVLGGYLIPGTYKYESGNQLIDAIDKELEKSNLSDKMTVMLTSDFTMAAKAMEADDIDDFVMTSADSEEGPLLYIMAPDIVRDSKPVQLSLVSGLGLATSWYLSIYPFLLNPTLAKRVEEQLAVADAGMTYDLDWLTELSVPLFASFVGIQLLHETAHRIVAAFANVKLSAPTFVPSLVTGITSSVTSFREPPKTREAMFDIAIAGPLVGFFASLVALAIGAQLTLTSDPATMAALPVDILRQSFLGGSVIDSVIQGSLFVPDGAPSQGLMISLHPLAVAGYISLIVNALALLPIGTTDGGRIALALFGRSFKQILGNLTLATLLFTGAVGSDLFLFYFAFIIAFQKGNEVPARNELDDIDVFRVALGGFSFLLAFLTLINYS